MALAGLLRLTHMQNKIVKTKTDTFCRYFTHRLVWLGKV